MADLEQVDYIVIKQDSFPAQGEITPDTIYLVPTPHGLSIGVATKSGDKIVRYTPMEEPFDPFLLS